MKDAEYYGRIRMRMITCREAKEVDSWVTNGDEKNGLKQLVGWLKSDLVNEWVSNSGMSDGIWSYKGHEGWKVMREAWVWISWMSGSGVIEMGLIGVKERM